MSLWKLQINDPTLAGWLCVAAYAIAVLSALLAQRASPMRADRNAWLSLAALCGILALNKQLDLHSLLIAFARSFDAAPHHDLNWIALGSALLFVVVGFAASFFLVGNIAHASKRARLAAGCLMLLGALLIARNTIPLLSRALGFHLITEDPSLLHIHLSEVFELFFAAAISALAMTTISAPFDQLAPHRNAPRTRFSNGS